MPAGDTRAKFAAPITSPHQQPELLCESCLNRAGVARDTPLRTVVCGPCWAGHGGEASAAEIGAFPLVSVLSRDPANQTEWLCFLDAEPWVQRLRSDARARLHRLAVCLRNWADWTDWTCRPTWPELCAASDWARSTMASWLRQLRLLGWLSVIEPGSTPQHRPMGSPAAAEGNRAAVYALRIPETADLARREQRLRQLGVRQDAVDPTASSQVTAPVVETWTPSLAVFVLKEGLVGSSEFESFNFVHNQRQSSHVWNKNEALRARLDQQKLDFQWSDRSPSRRAEMYAAACELRRQHPILARLTPRAIRAVASPYWTAGWVGDDVLHALAYRPTSRSTLPSPAEYAVIHPAKWCRARLLAWRDDRNRVLPAPARHQAEQDAVEQALRSRIGRGGLRLLRRDPAKPLVQHVAEHGRRCAQAAAADHAAAQHRAELDRQQRPNPPEMVASPAVRQAAVEAARAADERRKRAVALQRDLIERAKAHVESTASSAADCALERLRAEGRVPRGFGRRRPRW